MVHIDDDELAHHLVNIVDEEEDRDAPSERALDALSRAVSSARYWQEPDYTDLTLRSRVCAGPLQAVAEMVCRQEALQWWAEPFQGLSQAEVSFEAGGLDLQARYSRGALDDWLEESMSEELRAANRPQDPTAPWSGAWWSTPSGVRSTTHSAIGRAPLGLSCIEDAMGWGLGFVRSVSVESGATVYEIHEPADYVALVNRSSLEVTNSRRHDWFRCTGENHRWFVANFQALAHEIDGVHLSVQGYLSTAGRALPVHGGAAVLARWNPDETLWLGDVLQGEGEWRPWKLAERSETRWVPGE
jgi:hypothetical protein